MPSPASKEAGESSANEARPNDASGSAAAGGAAAGSQQPGTSTGGATPAIANTEDDLTPEQTAAVLAYFRKRGFKRAEDLLKAEIEALNKGATPAQARQSVTDRYGSPTVTVNELATKIAPREPAPGEKSSNGSAANGSQAQNGEKTGPLEQAAIEALRLDPTDRSRGFDMLKHWTEGSLDMYEPELMPILLPLFVHAYLDLVSLGYGAAAVAFFNAHSGVLLPRHASLLSQIRSISLPLHVATDPLSQRFRTERYVIKMSQTVFSLLLGWLTDGRGPVAGAGAAPGVSEGNDNKERRGREAMLKIINDRCRVQVLQTKAQELTLAMLEEGTGLTGATGPSYATRSAIGRHHPSLNPNAVSESDAVAEFNAAAAGPQLKLGAKIPLSERLAVEVQREAREEMAEEQQQTQAQQQVQTEQGDGGEEAKAAATAKAKSGTKEREVTPGSSGRKASATPAVGATSTAATVTTTDEYGLLQATYADLPPQPPVFRTVDIQREVARMRDARKALRFDLSLRGSGPSASVATGGPSSSSSSSSAGATGSGGATAAGSTAVASGSAGNTPAPAFLSGVRDATFNGLGLEGAKAAQTAALPSICAYTFHDADDGLTSCRFSPDLSLVAAGFEESFIQVWSTKGEPLRGLRSDFKLSEVRDRQSLRSKRDSSTISTRKLIGHSGPVYSIDFDPIAGTSAPSRNLLSASADGTARLWSMDTFTALVAYRGHQQPVWNVQWSPLGVYFATASADKTARLWSTERINPLRMYSGHHSDVDTLAFHPNSLYLATGSSDRTARLWDVQRGACVRLFVGHNDAVSALSMSKDGRYLATADGSPGGGGNGGGEISLWDLGSGRRIKKMWGHESLITSMDFSQDGSLLVSTAMDYTVRTWDVNAAQSALGGSAAANGSVPGKDAPTIPTTSSAAASSSSDLVATFYTKRTNMLDVVFTPRNLCLCAGPYDANL